ncbi:MAG: GNAT family N-acetyltransferase [Candidatus Electrothrix sp. GW3-4]|uniref:GNAT family N-acetyltransferase n=1 Tax=Candidatus Electrothrix sp. GW3-4 TaxID=3126740 RepID=UPI0030CAEF37
MIYNYLEWDSDFFGFKVSQIVKKEISKYELSLVLDELRKENFKLVYMFLLNGIVFSIPYVEIKYIQKKITYKKEIRVPIKINNNIRKFERKNPSDRLVNLAIVSGEFSRFRLDGNIYYSKFKELYEGWIVSSVNKKIALGVLVYEVNNIIAGMVTYDKFENHGKIGIISVDQSYRRLNIASSLLNAAEFYLAKAGCDEITIVTQDCNKPACRLYEKKGYKIKKIENVYHMWL